MTIDAMQALFICFLASICVNGLVCWCLISAPRGAHALTIPPAVTPGAIVGLPPAPSVVPGPVPPATIVPDIPGAVPTVVPPVVVPPVVVPAGSDFDKCVAVTLKWEGGNDDDPRDPGGRTSRGILQSEWDTWRQTHAGLPSDVWQAPQDQVLAIYKENYWNALYCDSLPPGADLVVFDYGVNSGVSRAAKLLQTLVGSDADGEVGPDTIGATAAIDPISLVGQFCDARLAFLKGLSTWGTFGNGWTNRVVDVRKEALALAATAPQPKPPVVSSGTVVSAAALPPWLATMRTFTGTHEGNDNPVILGFAAYIGKKFPDMASYCARYTHDSIAWCGLTVAYCMATAGIRPQFGASDTDKFLWADSWRQFGVAVSEPQLGDILIFQWASGGHHVTLYEGTQGSNYLCRGGNQSDAVNVEPLPKASCTGIRRPA